MSKDQRTGIERIADERRRQTEKLGWTPEHDNEHEAWELPLVAALYAAQAASIRLYEKNEYAAGFSFVDPFPWEERSDARFYPDRGNVVADVPENEEHRIRLLEKAGALIAAEIDRLLRGAS